MAAEQIALDFTPPTAEVSKPASDDKRNIFFWTHRDLSKDGDRYEGYTFSTHVTRFTPNWCERHQWGFAARCLACESNRD